MKGKNCREILGMSHERNNADERVGRQHQGQRELDLVPEAFPRKKFSYF